MGIYKSCLRSVLFQFDSEAIHNFTLRAGKLSELIHMDALFRKMFCVESPALEQGFFGITFKNPIGMAAGFDKDCKAPRFLGSLGFGHLELGTVTPEPQPGNPRPRIHRLSKDSALINSVGFPSIGRKAFAKKLKSYYGGSNIPAIGVNLGKNLATPLEEATRDYLLGFTELKTMADYFAVNVSSPNTPGLVKLQERSALTEILSAINSENTEKKPILLKISPDLIQSKIDEVIECAVEHQISGIVATNTTSAREGLLKDPDLKGGMSGIPLKRRSLDVVRYLHSIAPDLPIIGVGGVSSLEDVLEMFAAGASMVQIYTGLIYEGPSLLKNLNLGLVDLISKLKLKNVSELRELLKAEKKENSVANLLRVQTS